MDERPEQQSFLPADAGAAQERRVTAALAVRRLPYSAEVQRQLVEVLLYLEGTAGQTGGCWSKLDTISLGVANDLARLLPRRTVQRRLLELRSAGLIESLFAGGVWRHYVRWPLVRAMAGLAGPSYVDHPVIDLAGAPPAESGAPPTDSGARPPDGRGGCATVAHRTVPIPIPEPLPNTSTPPTVRTEAPEPDTRRVGAPTWDGATGGWGEVLVLLERAGVEARRLAVHRARANGLAPGEAVAICEHFLAQATRRGWTPGMLFSRLSFSAPHQAVDAGWPGGDKRHAKAEASQRALQAQARKREAEERQQAEQYAEADAMEKAWGAALDALRAAEVEALAERAQPGCAFFRRQLAELGRGSPMVRPLLLARLAEEAGDA